ncbi:hypothetical protein [Deinococcus sp. LM3]|uniref:hypothetical protein n=1 Tax=Deinococcus sp. LM3 TaxID=1938608 RepID=UPI000993EC93|nr:hypothetical protein [Deinococcus sp. LM3]OOV11794.1 hypothetical protein BXU09_19500 [Deinococcus sp. LM3]
MTYILPAPLTPEEADVLSVQHAFRRTPLPDGMIKVSFDSEAAMYACAAQLRDQRVAAVTVSPQR